MNKYHNQTFTCKNNQTYIIKNYNTKNPECKYYNIFDSDNNKCTTYVEVFLEQILNQARPFEYQLNNKKIVKTFVK